MVVGSRGVEVVLALREKSGRKQNVERGRRALKGFSVPLRARIAVLSIFVSGQWRCCFFDVKDILGNVRKKGSELGMIQ